MAVLGRIGADMGVATLVSSLRRRTVFLLFFTRLVRFFAFGLVAPIVVLHLLRLGCTKAEAGSAMSIIQIGDVATSLFMTWIADGIGRRTTMAIASVRMVLFGVVCWASSNPLVIVTAATIGILSPGGTGAGPFSTLETVMLGEVLEGDDLVVVISWHQSMLFLGRAIGTAFCGFLLYKLDQRGVDELPSYQTLYLVYALCGFGILLAAILMGPESERDGGEEKKEKEGHIEGVVVTAPRTQPSERSPLLPQPPRQQAPETESVSVAWWSTILPLALLFHIDGIGASLTPVSFIVLYFRTYFNACLSTITTTTALASLLAAVGALSGGLVARRLGLLGSLVITHTLGNIVTMWVPFLPSGALPLACILLVAREILLKLSTGPQRALLKNLLPSRDRSRWLGIVDSAAKAGGVIGPTIAGILAQQGSLRYSFVAAGLLRVAFNVGLGIKFWGRQ